MTLKKLNKSVKKFDVLDLGMIKWSTIAGTLLILNIWPAAMNWIANLHWGWLLAAFVILAWRPIAKWLK